MYNPETLIYPHVIGSTVNGPLGGRNDTRFFAKTVTNNMDSVIRTSTYWYIPEDGSEPVLVIEIDDEVTAPAKDTMDITVRIRRNDGLVYEGNQASQENIEEDSDA